MSTPTHPIQPLALDNNGVMRFKQNAIVRYLLDKGPFDMNHLACEKFSQEDRVQFAQLIGYSLSGFGELGYVDGDTYDAAALIAEGETEDKARIMALTEQLDDLRQDLRKPMAVLFGVHPDDLSKNIS